MITTNAAWDAKNAKLAKMPVYAFEIVGQTTIYTTHDLAAVGITGTLPTYAAWLKTPQGASQTIDPVNCTSSIGELQCEVVDHGGAVRTLVGGTTLAGSTVTLKVGYPGIAWSEFVVLQTYVLYKVNPKQGYGCWVFVSRDRQLLQKKTIYQHPENGQLLSDNNPWYLCGTPAEIFQAICLFALGLPAADVDRAAMVALDAPAEGLFAGTRAFQFTLTESFEAKQFLESEVFKPSLIYSVVNNVGQLSLRASRPPSVGATPVFTFTADNLCALPVIDRMPVINEAVWQYDYDGGGYQAFNTYLEATSISQFGRGNQYAVQSAGLRSELGADWYTEWVSAQLFKRFAGTPGGLRGGAPVMDIEAMFLTLPVWVGDYVAVTHALVPDLLTGSLGITDRIYEVIDREPDYSNGRMKYKLLDTGLTGWPASVPWSAFVIGTSLVY